LDDRACSAPQPRREFRPQRRHKRYIRPRIFRTTAPQAALLASVTTNGEVEVIVDPQMLDDIIEVDVVEWFTFPNVAWCRSQTAWRPGSLTSSRGAASGRSANGTQLDPDDDDLGFRSPGRAKQAPPTSFGVHHALDSAP
jgi:hypothetical protein